GAGGAFCHVISLRRVRLGARPAREHERTAGAASPRQIAAVMTMDVDVSALVDEPSPSGVPTLRRRCAAPGQRAGARPEQQAACPWERTGGGPYFRSVR